MAARNVLLLAILCRFSRGIRLADNSSESDGGQNAGPDVIQLKNIINLYRKGAPDDDSFESVVCNGPNTRRSKNGLCECVEGFEVGDPNSRYGCYHCASTCHANATCTYPGKCLCNGGMKGDGISTCSIPAPSIISISPDSVLSDGGDFLNISFYTPTNFTASSGFCKFGSQIVAGQVVAHGILRCSVPQSAGNAIRVSASFDSISWASEPIVLNLTKKKDPRIMAIFMVVALAVIGSAIFALILRRSRPKGQDDEAVPFSHHAQKMDMKVRVPFA